MTFKVQAYEFHHHMRVETGNRQRVSIIGLQAERDDQKSTMACITCSLDQVVNIRHAQ
jgi:hypothetical protein